MWRTQSLPWIARIGPRPGMGTSRRALKTSCGLNGSSVPLPRISREVYAARRRRLLRLLPPNSLLVLPASDTCLASGHDILFPHRQHSTFFHFFGYDAPLRRGLAPCTAAESDEMEMTFACFLRPATVRVGRSGAVLLFAPPRTVDPATLVWAAHTASLDTIAEAHLGIRRSAAEADQDSELLWSDAVYSNALCAEAAPALLRHLRAMVRHTCRSDQLGSPQGLRAALRALAPLPHLFMDLPRQLRLEGDVAPRLRLPGAAPLHHPLEFLLSLLAAVDCTREVCVPLHPGTDPDPVPMRLMERYSVDNGPVLGGGRAVVSLLAQQQADEVKQQRREALQKIFPDLRIRLAAEPPGGPTEKEDMEESNSPSSGMNAAPRGAKDMRLADRPLHDAGGVLWRYRMCKSPDQILQHLRSAAATAYVFLCLYHAAAHTVQEHELQYAMDSAVLRLRRVLAPSGFSVREAYIPVIAAGRRSFHIHYTNNNFVEDRVRGFPSAGVGARVDAGVEVDYVPTDCTRTFPLGTSSFHPGDSHSPAHRIYAPYMALLQLQRQLLQSIRHSVTVGDVSVRHLNGTCRELGNLFRAAGPGEQTNDITVPEVRQVFCAHFFGHPFGLDIHEVHPPVSVPPAHPVERRESGLPALEQITAPLALGPKVLTAGMVHTVEPGFYFPDEQHAEAAEQFGKGDSSGKAWATTVRKIPAALRGMGVQVEDDVLVLPPASDTKPDAVPADPWSCEWTRDAYLHAAVEGQREQDELVSLVTRRGSSSSKRSPLVSGMVLGGLDGPYLLDLYGGGVELHDDAVRHALLSSRDRAVVHGVGSPPSAAQVEELKASLLRFVLNQRLAVEGPEVAAAHLGDDAVRVVEACKRLRVVPTSAAGAAATVPYFPDSSAWYPLDVVVLTACIPKDPSLITCCMQANRLEHTVEKDCEGMITRGAYGNAFYLFRFSGGIHNSCLHTYAKVPPGLRRVPYSLEASLFFAQRELLSHVISTTRLQRQVERHPYTKAPLGTDDAAEDYQYLLRDLLSILFQMPHLEQIMRQHFSETENIIRLVGNTYFSNATEPEVLSYTHRLAATVLESAPEGLTTADLIILTSLLQRDAFFSPYAAAQHAKKATAIQEGSDTAAEGSSSSAAATARLQESRGSTGAEAAKRYEKTEPQGAEVTPVGGYSQGTLPSSGRSQTSADSQAREALLMRLYRMFYERLLKNVANGFPDDNLIDLCKRPAFVRGFHALQADSMESIMTCSEFTFFLTLLNDRIKRKMCTVAAADIATAGQQELQLDGIPAELLRTVGLAMERLALFHSLEAIGEHRPLATAELRFIIDIALSPVPLWSTMGLKVFRRFVAMQLRRQRQAGGPADVLAELDIEDQAYIRGLCLRRLAAAPLQQLATGLLHMLPLFMFPVLETSSSTQRVAWETSATLRYMTISQKKRLCSVCRSALYLLRAAPPMCPCIVKDMAPLDVAAADVPIEDDVAVMDVLTRLSECFLEHVEIEGPPFKPRRRSRSSPPPEVAVESAEQRQKRMAIRRVMLEQERLRAYFSVCEHTLHRHKCLWLVSSPASHGAFEDPRAQKHFDTFVRILLPEGVDAAVLQDSSASAAANAVLLNISRMYGLMDILPALFTFLRFLQRSTPAHKPVVAASLVPPSPIVAQKLEVAVLRTIQHMITTQVEPAPRPEHLEQLLRYMVQTLTFNYIYSQARRQASSREEATSTPTTALSSPVPTAVAELAAACLELYMQSRTGTAARGAPRPAQPMSLAVLSVVVLNGLVLPQQHQHLQPLAFRKETLLQLFNDFGVESFSLVYLYELLSLVFTRRLPLSAQSATASGGYEAEDGMISAIDADDVEVLEAAVQAVRRTSYHHSCYESLSLQERVRIVEHCTRIYAAVQHRFYTLELAQAVGIRCISACAYLSLEHQLSYRVSEAGRGGDYERRRLEHLAQSLWHFYAMAMARPVHSGPQVEKFMTIILRFLRKRVAMVPQRQSAASSASANQDFGLITREYAGDAKDDEGALTQRVQWKDLEQVRRVNEVFTEYVEKLIVQNTSRLAEQKSIALTSAQQQRAEDMTPNHAFSLSDAEDALLAPLSIQERAILFRNVALRRALRHPVHAFQVALTAVKDNLSARRGVHLSELYITLLHAHAHELLPALWKEVCSQLMYFRLIYQRADSPGVCVLDTKPGREVLHIMPQLMVSYLQFEQAASPPPSGGFLDLSCLSYLYTSAAMATRQEPLLLMSRGGSGTSAVPTGALTPADLEPVAELIEKTIKREAAAEWRGMTEKQYSPFSQTSILHLCVDGSSPLHTHQQHLYGVAVYNTSPSSHTYTQNILIVSLRNHSSTAVRARDKGANACLFYKWEIVIVVSTGLVLACETVSPLNATPFLCSGMELRQAPRSEVVVLFLLLVGLPGSGKSTFIQHLHETLFGPQGSLEAAHEGSRHPCRIELDVFQLDRYLLDSAVSEKDKAVPADSPTSLAFTPERWKRASHKMFSAVSRRVDELVAEQCAAMSASYPSSVDPDLPRAEQALAPCRPPRVALHLLVIEDNMHLRSMRERYWKLCRSMESRISRHATKPAALCHPRLMELRLDVDLEECLRRNAARPPPQWPRPPPSTAREFLRHSHYVDPAAIASLQERFEWCCELPPSSKDSGQVQWVRTSCDWLVAAWRDGSGEESLYGSPSRAVVRSFLQWLLHSDDTWQRLGEQGRRLEYLRGCAAAEEERTAARKRARGDVPPVLTVGATAHRLDQHLRQVVGAFFQAQHALGTQRNMRRVVQSEKKACLDRFKRHCEGLTSAAAMEMSDEWLDREFVCPFQDWLNHLVPAFFNFFFYRYSLHWIRQKQKPTNRVFWRPFFFSNYYLPWRQGVSSLHRSGLATNYS
eukprot:gene6744-4837_t